MEKQNNKGQVFVHIGYHKSASTMMQKILFSNLPINYLFLDKDIKYLKEDSFNDFEFKELISKELEKKQSNKYDKTVISHEELSGHPLGHSDFSLYQVADNIKKAYPKAKIIIIIRNQLDYLSSIYCFRVAIKGYETKGACSYLNREASQGLFAKLEYHKLIEYYIKLFSKENVLVVPMELLKKDFYLFSKEITDFMEINSKHLNKIKNQKINVSTSLSLVLYFWRIVNIPFYCFVSTLQFLKFKKAEYLLRMFFYKVKRKLTPKLNKIFKNSKKVSIKKCLSKETINTYKKSNLKIKKITELDLNKSNYL